MLRSRSLQIVLMTLVIAGMMMAFTLAAPDEATRGESVRFPNGPHNLVTNFLDTSDD